MRSPLMQGRGLKPAKAVAQELNYVVAPHAGAWIETICFADAFSASESPLMQGRGLKPVLLGDWLRMACRPSCRGVD